jgi:tryptophan-rich sensory protein
MTDLKNALVAFALIYTVGYATIAYSFVRAWREISNKEKFGEAMGK